MRRQAHDWLLSNAVSADCRGRRVSYRSLHFYVDREDSMNCSMLCQRVVLTSALVLGGLASGCATVVRPLSPAQPISTDGSHGLLVGHIRLAWHEPDQSARSKQPLAMKWSLTEEMQGTHIVLADLPTAGLFAVKLPAGSYRLTGISFNNLRGPGTLRCRPPFRSKQASVPRSEPGSSSGSQNPSLIGSRDRSSGRAISRTLNSSRY